MKRRKKLLITCLVLVAVLALCLLAFANRPKPYRFLRGAVLKDIQLYQGGISGRPSKAFVMYSYELDAPAQEVLKDAKLELSDKLGWKWFMGHVTRQSAVSADGETDVLVSYSWPQVAIRQVPVRVRVTRPATLLDRILQWLHSR